MQDPFLQSVLNVLEGTKWMSLSFTLWLMVTYYDTSDKEHSEFYTSIKKFFSQNESWLLLYFIMNESLGYMTGKKI